MKKKSEIYVNRYKRVTVRRAETLIRCIAILLIRKAPYQSTVKE